MVDGREAVHARNQVALETQHLGRQLGHIAFQRFLDTVAGNAAEQAEVDDAALAHGRQLNAQLG